MFRLMGIWVEDVVCTVVPLSCVRGGSTTLLRTDAIRELRYHCWDPRRNACLYCCLPEKEPAIFASTGESVVGLKDPALASGL